MNVNGSKYEQFPHNIVVKGITGLEKLEYEVRLVRGAINLFISRGDDRRVQQALAKDIFNFFKGSVPDLILQDFADNTETAAISLDEVEDEVRGVVVRPDEFTDEKRVGDGQPFLVSPDKLTAIPSQGGNF